MSRVLVPGRRPLLLPGTDRRAIRRPSPSGLIIPQLSGAPLSSNEIDYDELDILRQWREYAPDDPDQVRYFCYELEQLNPGAKAADHFFKAVRMIRLTRIPRYLRQQPATEEFRDLLAGLREKQILFLNIIAKSPKLPLVFAYGVQGVGATIEEATAAADEAYAALSFSLDGTYQQLEYQPLSVAEGELLARYQNEWRHIAMARGRPVPANTGMGASAVLDGNRTDVSQTNDAISSFVRGMGDKSFMLSMVTVPLSPEDMSHAWRNIAVKLSAVRSDQQGSRSVGASFSLPLGMGSALSDGSGTTHGLTGTSGTGSSDGLSASETSGMSISHSDGVSASESQGVSASQSQGVSASDSYGVSSSQTEGISASQSEGVSESQSLSASDSTTQSVTDSVTESTSVGESISQGQSVSATQGTTDSISIGTSTGLTDTRSFTESVGASQGQSLGVTNSAASNWSNSVGQSLSAGQTLTDSWSQSFAESLTQSWGLSESRTDGTNSGASEGGSSSIGGGLDAAGLSATLGESWQNSWGTNFGLVTGSNLSQSGGASATNGIGSSLGNSLTQSLNVGESAGGSLGQSVTGTNTVGTSQSMSAGQSLGVSQSQSASQGTSVSSSAGIGSSMSQGASLSQGLSSGQSLSAAAGQSLSSGIGAGTSSTAGIGASSSGTVGESATSTLGTSATATQGVSATATQGVSSTDSVGASLANTTGASTGMSTQQAVSDAWMVAMSRQASQSGSFGIMPGVNASISRATFDEAKRALGDVLEAQMKRYHDGIEGGAMLYQMFLVTEDRETLAGAASLLKAAFWGPGGADKGRVVQPFHTIMIDDDDEAGRLLTHATALTHYRKREPVMDLIEPHVFSSYVTTGEAAVFSAPPTSEAIGLMAQTDSMPVFAMPSDRGERDMYLGNIVNGERGRVSDQLYGIDLNEITHMLIQGVTGMGKTSTMMRVLEQAVGLRREITTPPTLTNPVPSTKVGRAGVLCFDWMNNMRDLASIVEPERFQLFSVSEPELGAFRWNPLEIPHPKMAAHQWLGSQADQLAASFGLGEVGRSLLAENIDKLYMANRLEPFVLREQKVDEESGAVLRSQMVLPAVDRADLPAGAIVLDDVGNEVANVYSCPLLSRLVSLEHLAVLIVSLVEQLATQEGAREMGTAMRDRVQSVWRRIQYYAPGGPLASMVACDPDLRTRECLAVTDLIDPDRGLVTVIDADGLDQGNRRVILGSVMLAVYRYGLHVGKGAFDNGGRGAGTFLILEEAHELFGATDEGEDSGSVKMRVNLYESMFRRARATGLRLVAMTQNCGAIPASITSQTTTVIVHRTYDQADRSRICDLFSWDRGPLGQLREVRFLGEMPRGYALVRLDARDSYLESSPVHILVDPPAIPPATDELLVELANTRAERLSRAPQDVPMAAANAPAWATVSGSGFAPTA